MASNDLRRLPKEICNHILAIHFGHNHKLDGILQFQKEGLCNNEHVLLLLLLLLTDELRAYLKIIFL